MKSILGRKQSIRNEDWIKAIEQIEELVSKHELERLVKQTLKEIIKNTENKKVAYAWSGGKDSIVLGDICKKAGIENSMLAICNLEYPAFLNWVINHKPKGLEIINTGQDMKWLVAHEEMLFPKDSTTAARWFSIVQHRAQTKYYKDNNLNMILLGRRKADGNYCGENGMYTNKKGITRYSPLADWSHEAILAYLHYYKLQMPPIYAWYNGYLCGTHPWAARQWTDNAWKEVYEIDSNIVMQAAKFFPAAKQFLNSL